jgi:protein-L-isoaspartate(D-aspartate) O-methyltransferase
MHFDPAIARRNMVLSQIRPFQVTDEAVIAAMSKVPRERFVAPELAALAYIDEDVAIAPGRALLAPAIFARLLQVAEIAPNDKVLDIGAATGYSAAVLSELAGKVIALENDPELAVAARGLLGTMAPTVEVVQGALEHGDSQHAPFDVMVFEGAIDEMPGALLGQLADGGRAVAVVGGRGRTKATIYRRHKGEIAARSLFDATAPCLPGFAKAHRFVF